MRVVLAVLCLAVGALSQNLAGVTHRVTHHATHASHAPTAHTNVLGHLVHSEVRALIAADATLTQSECEVRCDAMFQLGTDTTEQQLDTMCTRACACEIAHNCDHHNNHHGNH